MYNNVCVAVARIAGIPEGGIDENTPLMELGFDSLGLTDLTYALSVDFDLQLSPTVTFEHPTAFAMSNYLRRRLGGIFADEEKGVEMKCVKQSLAPEISTYQVNLKLIK